MARRVIATVLAALIAGGCARDRAIDGAPRPDAGAPRFAAAEKILSGFEIGPDTGVYRTGDRVLVGLRVERASEVAEKYLMITAMPYPGLTLSRGTMTWTYEGKQKRSMNVVAYRGMAQVFDGEGREIAQTAIDLPASCLITGLFDYGTMEVEKASWDEQRTLAAPSDLPWLDRHTLAFLSLIFGGQMLRDTKALSDLLDGVIQRPGLIDAVFGGGFSINESAPSRIGDPVELGGVPLPSVFVAMKFEYGWTTLGRLSGRVVPCVPPLGLVGGLLDGLADNPDLTHGARVEVKLLAAKRGTGEQWKPQVPQVTSMSPDSK